MSSVRDWVSNKACKLRKYFINLGMLVLDRLILGKQYRADHPDEDYEQPDAFPDMDMLQGMIGTENVMDWLDCVRTRVDLKKCMKDRALRKALLHVFTLGFRYYVLEVF